MVINQLYAKYFQKSKLFLYPLLGLQRGLTAPEEVYFSWEGKYAPEDQKLILVYNNVSSMTAVFTLETLAIRCAAFESTVNTSPGI